MLIHVVFLKKNGWHLSWVPSSEGELIEALLASAPFFPLHNKPSFGDFGLVARFPH